MKTSAFVKETMKIYLNPRYEQYRQVIAGVHERFSDEGKTIYSGRNTIKTIMLGDTVVAVKRYRSLGLLKGIIYTLFRSSKALRSFRNSGELRRRKISVPEEVATIEVSRCGLLHTAYYICEYRQLPDIRTSLIDTNPYSDNLMQAYSEFVARLHERGILHRDLNPSNVLYEQKDGSYDFYLIDINRMKFFDTPVPKADCMENLTLFWWLTDTYKDMLKRYAAVRLWDEEDIKTAVDVKIRHDRNWKRRKRITGKLKKLLT